MAKRKKTRRTVKRRAAPKRRTKKIKGNCKPCFVKVGKARDRALRKHAKKTRRKALKPRIKRTTKYYGSIGRKRVAAWRRYAKG